MPRMLLALALLAHALGQEALGSDAVCQDGDVRKTPASSLMQRKQVKDRAIRHFTEDSQSEDKADNQEGKFDIEAPLGVASIDDVVTEAPDFEEPVAVWARAAHVNASCSFDAMNSAFVSSSSGTDADGYGASADKPYKTIAYAVTKRKACQTIHVMSGTYRNNNFGAGMDNEAVVNLDGVSDLAIKGYEGNTALPVIEFDGVGGFVGGPVKNVEISDLEIVGPGKSITYPEALAERLNSKKRFRGRGVSILAGDHISLHGLVVHHCPSSGISVNNADYVAINSNIVYSNTWWSPAGESALVLATSKNVDDEEGVKMLIASNIVYGNMNKVPYYNKDYSWDYSPLGDLICGDYPACREGKVDGCPWQCRYGQSTQDYIIDGMGILVASNRATYLKGETEISDNVCYGNGINGIKVDRTDRVQVKRNMIYDNGHVPRGDKPVAVAQDWHASVGTGRQHYSGLVLSNFREATLWSNLIAARYADDYAFAQEADTSDSLVPLLLGGNNKVCRGKMDVAPSPVVDEVHDVTVCGLKYEEVNCGTKCHLVQWPHSKVGSFAADDAKSKCEVKCANAAFAGEGGCKAFSLQSDSATNNGNRECIIYKQSPEPSDECKADPFNAAGCSNSTLAGEFFITPAAKAEYDVLDFLAE